MRLAWMLLFAACSDGNSCGNGKVCDGARACSELGASWTGGTAACRADCSGWDVSTCQRGANGDDFELVKPAERDPARFSTARCNDGTPFTMAVRLAPSPSSDWFIHLEGGVFCDDVALQCSQREMRLTSTGLEGDREITTTNRGGFFSSDPAINPDFHAANLAYGYYCSSDFWSGDGTQRRPTTGDPAAGWYFSGRTNVAALLSILVERYGLDDGDAKLRVMWGGSSAGAHGAHFNSAVIAARLPATFAAGRIKLFADAGWMIGWDDANFRIVNTTMPDREVWRNALAFWGGSLDPECTAAHGDPIDCWFGTGWYPVVSARLPVFVQQCALDSSFGLSLHALMPGPSVMAWRNQSRSEMARTKWLFSGVSMPYHTIALTDEGVAMGPPGSTLREVLGRFWAGGAPERVEF